MIAIVRTTKLTDTKKANAEDESIELSNDQAVGVETECYGGEQGPQSEDEDVTGSESWRARYVFDRAELVGFSPDKMKSLLLLEKARNVQR